MRRRRHALLSAALAALVVQAGPVSAADGGVLVVLSERGGAYAEVAQAASGAMPHTPVTVVLAEELGERQSAALTIAVGASGCRTALESHHAGAVLCALVPSVTFRRIADTPAARRKPRSAVVLDQPLSRELALVRLAMPDRRRVGALFGPDSQALATLLEDTAKEQGLRIVARRVANEEQISPSIQRLLKECDVLLALPDRVVFQGGTVQNVLRASFEHRVPVIGISPAYVRAGALISLYSTPAQIGRQAGTVARAFLSGHALPEVQAPHEFEIGVNRHIAQALGIDAPDPHTLADTLRKLEQAQ